MKLNIRLMVMIAILLFITILHTYSKQSTTAGHRFNRACKMSDSKVATDLFSPRNIILVKLP